VLRDGPPPATPIQVKIVNGIASGLLALLDDLHDQIQQALWRFDPVSLFQSWSHTLGPTITGFLMGATAEQVEAWADPDSDVAFPAPQAIEGVAFAQRIWGEMAHHLGDDDEARAWFITSNPWLPDEITPLEAIRKRDFASVVHAVAQHRHDEKHRPPTAAERARRHLPVQIWSLWDAGDLVSLHSTQLGAQDAREVHLYRNGGLPAEEQALLDRATEICPTVLHVT